MFTAFAGPALANPSFQQGRKYLDLMEDSRAVEMFIEALQWSKNTRSDRAKIFLYLGFAQYNLLDKISAEQSFKKALAEDPLVELPRVTSPEIAALVSRIRAAQLSSRPAAVVPPARLTGGGDPPLKNGQPAQGVADSTSAAPRRINWPAWTCLGLGAALGVAGITLGLMARSEDQQVKDLTLSTMEAQRHYDTGYREAMAAYVLFATAGAALVTSGVFFYLGWSPNRSASAAVVPTKTGLLLQVGGYAW